MKLYYRRGKNKGEIKWISIKLFNKDNFISFLGKLNNIKEEKNKNHRTNYTF